MSDAIFAPLAFRNLTIDNRILRSNLAGRFDGYDGSGSEARINWELKFARGGVGAILSSWCGVHPRGRIVPNFASIDADERVPFWRRLGERVHEHGCKYVLQLAHGGRQRDIAGFEFVRGLSSTGRDDPLHGFPAEQMTTAQIGEVVQSFAAGARRAREAGLDGVEIHAANGYLFTQFLSPAINERTDDYGGSLENRARLLLDVVAAIRAEVGRDYHLQVKLNGTDYHNAFLPWLKRGTTIEESVQVSRWLEETGVDAIHVSAGSAFPHPENPAGAFPRKDVLATYDVLLSSGRRTFGNYLLFRTWPINRVMQRRWQRPPDEVEGRHLPDARKIKAAVSVPVLCTGGFQTASVIRAALADGSCDAVTIGRPLVANNDLVRHFQQGRDRAPRPCTYSNKCLFNVLENPIGCYDESRYSSRAEMIGEIMSVFEPASEPAE